MATRRNKRKLAAVSRETQESARNSQSQNTFVPGIIEEYITQVSELVEGRVTKHLSQEFSRTESSILGSMSKLDEFLLNPQVLTCSRTVPGTTQNNDLENREPTEDRSQNDPYPKVEFSTCQTCNSADSDQEETSHTTFKPFVCEKNPEEIANSVEMSLCLGSAIDLIVLSPYRRSEL